MFLNRQKVNDIHYFLLGWAKWHAQPYNIFVKFLDTNDSISLFRVIVFPKAECKLHTLVVTRLSKHGMPNLTTCDVHVHAIHILTIEIQLFLNRCTE